MALIYTAIVTPVEVAFLAPPIDRLRNGVFLANRGVDIIFIIDMLIQFRVMVRITDSEGTRWLRKPEEIARHYIHRCGQHALGTRIWGLRSWAQSWRLMCMRLALVCCARRCLPAPCVRRSD